MTSAVHPKSEAHQWDVTETIVDGERGLRCLVCDGILTCSFHLINGWRMTEYVHERRADYKRCQFIRGVINGARP